MESDFEWSEFEPPLYIFWRSLYRTYWISIADIIVAYACYLIHSLLHFNPLVISNIRNCNVSTEILGSFAVQPDEMNRDFEEEKKQTLPYAIATLDGNIIFAKNEDVLWSLQVVAQNKDVLWSLQVKRG